MSVARDLRLSLTSAILLFALCVGLYGFMAYGGVRTPDGEIVFRVAESLAENASFALRDDLVTWPGFGVARGTDGRIYSLYAPGQSILLAPVVRLGLIVNQTHWYDAMRFNIPVSFTVDADSLKDYLLGRQPAHPEKHALRFLVSFFIPVIAALAVVVYFFIIRRLTASTPAGLMTSVLLALATPLWSYSGTMFKEPLTILWTLLSFYFLIRNDSCYEGGKKKYGRLFLAGLFIGLGFFTHTTIILFVPLFFVYGIYPYFITDDGRNILQRLMKPVLVFTGGFFLFTAAFCWLNYARFGHILETGRWISPVAYGPFVWPWEGMVGFLSSPGKGLLWFCPVILAGIVWWPRFHKTNRVLSCVLIGMIVFRWVFISCFGDWHGGFCLGPRHLLPVVPFLLIPVAVYLSGWFTPGRPSGRRRYLLVLFFLACVIQQVYFCLGEPISFYYLIKQHYLERGVAIITDNSIYFNWRASPLFFLLEANRSPFLLQKVPLDNYTLLLLVSLVISLITGLVVVLARGFDKIIYTRSA